MIFLSSWLFVFNRNLTLNGRKWRGRDDEAQYELITGHSNTYTHTHIHRRIREVERHTSHLLHTAACDKTDVHKRGVTSHCEVWGRGWISVGGSGGIGIGKDVDRSVHTVRGRTFTHHRAKWRNSMQLTVLLDVFDFCYRTRTRVLCACVRQ